MIDRTVSTVIDAETCIGCGFCAEVCPSGTISIQGNEAVVDNEKIQSVIAIGYPDEQYRKVAGRENASVGILIGNMKNHA